MIWGKRIAQTLLTVYYLPYILAYNRRQYAEICQRWSVFNEALMAQFFLNGFPDNIFILLLQPNSCNQIVFTTTNYYYYNFLSQPNFIYYHFYFIPFTPCIYLLYIYIYLFILCSTTN